MNITQSQLREIMGCSGTSATTGLDDAEARAELDPASAQRIVAIPGDGDDAIRALTALQDWVGRRSGWRR